MKKVIFVEELKQMILAERDKLAEGKKGMTRNGIRKALRCLERCPPARVKIVKYGRWKTTKSDRIVCSECGAYPLYGRDGRQTDAPHCWMCGAYMWWEETNAESN